MLLAGALWRSCCWPGRRGGEPSGISCCRGAVAESHRESAACRNAVAELHREANKRTQKEKGPEETLTSLPSHFYLLPCERATRHATRPNRRSPLAFTVGIHRRHAALAQLPLQLCRDCKEGCSKCKNCVELWEYGKDKGVTEYVLSV